MTEQAKVPAIRFAGFTDPWEQRKLGELVDNIDTGRSVFCSESYGRYPVLGSTSVIGSDSSYDYEGAFLLTARVGANAGNLYRFAGKVKISDNTVFLQAPNSDFLFYLLGHFDLRKLSFGTGQPLVRASELRAVEIDVPKLENEQKSIAEFFDHLDSLITLHQRKYDKLVIFKKSMLEKMFPKDGESVPEIRFAGFTDPWEQRKLSEVATFGGGHTPPMADPDNYEDGYVLWVTSQDVKSNYLDRTTTQITEKGAKELTLYPAGSLVMVTRSGILRHTLPVAELRKPSTVNQDIRVILPQGECCGEWLLQFFISHNKELLLEFGKTGTTVESVDFGKIKDMLLYMPSTVEQQQIGDYFAKLDSLITLHQRKLELLQNIKKSLLDKMFV